VIGTKKSDKGMRKIEVKCEERPPSASKIDLISGKTLTAEEEYKKKWK